MQHFLSDQEEHTDVLRHISITSLPQSDLSDLISNKTFANAQSGFDILPDDLKVECLINEIQNLYMLLYKGGSNSQHSQDDASHLHMNPIDLIGHV